MKLRSYSQGILAIRRDPPRNMAKHKIGCSDTHQARIFSPLHRGQLPSHFFTSVECFQEAFPKPAGRCRACCTLLDVLLYPTMFLESWTIFLNKVSLSLSLSLSLRSPQCTHVYVHGHAYKFMTEFVLLSQVRTATKTFGQRPKH